MRFFTKAPIPESLAKHAEEWTELLRKAIGENADSKTLRKLRQVYHDHPDIKQALLEEANGKCVYCESNVIDAQAGQVDHYWHFEKERPELSFDWSNFLLCCPGCNRSKGRKNKRSIPFINPSEDDPSNHLQFVGFILVEVADCPRGKRTHEELSLNGPRLLAARERISEKLDRFIEALLNNPKSKLAPEILEVLSDGASPENEHSMFTEYYLSFRRAQSSKLHLEVE